MRLGGVECPFLGVGFVWLRCCDKKTERPKGDAPSGWNGGVRNRITIKAGAERAREIEQNKE